jgi:mRNA interferase RelE/StbE
MPGTKVFSVIFLEAVTKNHIPNLPMPAKKRIITAINERLKVDPIGFGKPLRYSLKGLRRLRVGDYRIVYRIEAETTTVVIVAIAHRKDIYGI